MPKKYTYHNKPKIQTYPDNLTMAKFRQRAKNENRSESSLALYLIYQGVKDVVLDDETK